MQFLFRCRKNTKYFHEFTRRQREQRDANSSAAPLYDVMEYMMKARKDDKGRPTVLDNDKIERTLVQVRKKWIYG